jgi:hypothetical protein
MSALEELLSELREVCAGLEDKRQGQACRYTMADIGLAAFSVFFLQGSYRVSGWWSAGWCADHGAGLLR